MKIKMLAVAVMIITSIGQAHGQNDPKLPTLRFNIERAKGLLTHKQDGRLYVVMSARGGGEPRFQIGRAGLDSPPILAGSIRDPSAFSAAVLDWQSFLFPLKSLDNLKPGEYTVQAVFDFNPDLKSPNAPGNLYSEPIKLTLDPMKTKEIKLMLTKTIPPETLPADSESVKYVKMQSALLSKFYGRPIFLRAGVILPRDYAKEPERHYPLRVHIGGYGSRYTGVAGMMRPNSAFAKAWAEEDAPRMILLHLDGAGPLGDPYQVNSANHGPFGDAITQELIPFVEQKFRGIGKPSARVLDGGSTGGWVSFALQVFYPDFFNGCWSYSPDPVDFRAYELVNIYKDKNAYVNAAGFERPSARQRNGDTQLTMRNEVGSENLVGMNSSYTLSGGQWGAWNATYSPRGKNGLPVPLWDAKTGTIHLEVAEQWKKYDLRLYLETNWITLAPRLRGKIHIWVGEADEYFLNNAVHLLDDFLSKADPPHEGTIKYGAGKGHVWVDLNDRQIMDAMQTHIEKSKNSSQNRPVESAKADFAASERG